MNDADAIRLENRLTRLEGLPNQLEQLGLSLTAQINVVLAETRDNRRILDLHLTKDEAWMDKHTTEHAHARGVAEGKALANKAMVALMGGVLALVTFVASLLSPVINRALGG